MTHEYLLWICTACYGIHILEEYELNWRDWARSVLNLPVDWNSFYVVNALVLVLGVSCAEVGWKEPAFALTYPALMLINAKFFHVIPTLARRVFSPGLVTALVLFYPIGGWTYYGAWQDGVLTPGVGVASFVLGGALMALPIVLLKVKDRMVHPMDRDRTHNS
jgi:hypothetical protein